MIKALATFSIKVFIATILFWLMTFLIFVISSGFISSYVQKTSGILAQQFSTNVKNELVECSISPILTRESYRERQLQENKEGDGESSWGLLNLSSEDIENMIDVYLELTTFQVDCL